MRRRFRETRAPKEIQEIKTVDLSKEQSQDGFKSIRPETDITFEEAKQFWDDLFNSL